MNRDEPAVRAAQHVGLRGAHPGQRTDFGAVALVTDESVGRERDRGLKHAGLDAPALAGTLALIQRAENPVGGIEAADIVGQRRPADARIFRFDELAQYSTE